MEDVEVQGEYTLAELKKLGFKKTDKVYAGMDILEGKKKTIMVESVGKDKVKVCYCC